MSTSDAGVVQPYSPQPLSGQVLDPSHVASAQANLGHQFFNVIRHLVRNSGAYHNEDEQTKHLAVLQRYENAITDPADRQHLLSEADHAPREDVSERVPPSGQANVVVPQVPAIDYGVLARAIVAEQDRRAAEAASVAPAGQ